MSSVRFWSVFLLVLLVVVPITSVRVGAWSEVVVTKPWTEEEATEKEEEPAGQPVEQATEESESKESVPDKAETFTLPESPRNPEIDDFLLNFENLYGTWYIWTPSTVVNIQQPGTGEYLGHKFVEGAEQGIIVINKDGTYSMSHTGWAKGETVSGEWRLSFPREINGEVLQAIILVDGITGVDWAVAPSANGKIRLLWAMGWADGSATWIFDSELFQP